MLYVFSEITKMRIKKYLFLDLVKCNVIIRFATQENREEGKQLMAR